MTLSPISEDQKELLSRLTAFFKARFQSLEIMLLPCASAVAHTLRTAELRFLRDEGLSILDQRPDFVWIHTRQFQDTLKHALFRLHEYTAHGGSVATTTVNHFTQAANLLKLSWDYSRIEDSLTSCRIGDAVLREGPANTFRCEYLDPSALARMSHRAPVRESEGIVGIKARMSLRPQADVAVALDLVSASVRSLGPLTFYYYRGPDILDALEPMADRLVSSLESSLPKSCSIGPYTLNDFWTFWRHLFALTLRQGATAVAVLHDPSLECLPLNTPLVEMDKDQLVSHISKRSGLPQGIVDSLVKDLSYDSSIPFTDIMLQPIIPSGDRLLISPSILGSSGAERNLVALWNKLPERKRAYDSLSGHKERLLLPPTESLLQSAGFEVRTRIDIPGITDADLVAWRRDEGVFLIIQAKSLLGPDSVYEVHLHDAQLQEGVVQAEKVMTWAAANPAEFVKCCRCDAVPINGLVSCVLSSPGGPMYIPFHPSIPILSVTDFRDVLLKHRATTVARLHTQLLKKERPALRPLDTSEVAIEVPPYTFIKVAYTPPA
jgi:hypothetical protein